MTVFSMTPTVSRILARSTVGTTQHYGASSQALGGLYPLTLAAFELDSYRMMSGFPVAVPENDIHAETLLSSTGEILQFRELPRVVESEAVIRWIADEDDHFDPVAGTWAPFAGNDYGIRWQSGSPFTPTYLPEYEYRVGDEVFFGNALNFDADFQQHMWTDLGPVLAGAAGYSVIMVVNLHSVFGDSDPGTMFTGLWCPGLPTQPGDTFIETQDSYMSVTLRGESLYLDTEQTTDTKSLSLADLLALSQPIYLAFCFGRPYTTLYAGAGPSSLRSMRTFAGATPTGLSSNVVLGRSTGTILNTADMAVLDLGVYADQLTGAQVRNEIAKLSSCYGGDK